MFNNKLMTLEEAIEHAEEVACSLEEKDKCSACAAQHRQLAKWLKELKAMKENKKQYARPEQVYKLLIQFLSWDKQHI